MIDEPDSPCVSICLLDENDVCVGCFRTGDEITDWFSSDAQAKLDILARCQQRREAAQTIRLK